MNELRVRVYSGISPALPTDAAGFAALFTGTPSHEEFLEFGPDESSIDWVTLATRPAWITATENFAVEWAGWIWIAADGNYDFRVKSNDGSELFINDAIVTSIYGAQAATFFSIGTKSLTEGWARFRYRMMQGGGEAAAKVDWRPSSANIYGSESSFEMDTFESDFFNATSGTPTLTSAQASHGSKSMAMGGAATLTWSHLDTNLYRLPTPGSGNLRLRAKVRSASTGRNSFARIVLYNSARAVINTLDGSAVTDSSASWTEVTNLVALSGYPTAHYARSEIVWTGAAEDHYVDDVGLFNSDVAWSLGNNWEGVLGSECSIGVRFLSPGASETLPVRSAAGPEISWDSAAQESFRLGLVGGPVGDWELSQSRSGFLPETEWMQNRQYQVVLDIDDEILGIFTIEANFFILFSGPLRLITPEEAIVAPFVKVTRRVDIYESDGTTLWMENVPIVTGSVTVDYSRPERRMFDFEIDNSEVGIRVDPAEGSFWYDKVIKVYRGVRTATGQHFEYPLGVFLPDSITDREWPRTISVQARDRTKILLHSEFAEPTAFMPGFSLWTVVNAMAGNAGIFDLDMPTDEVAIFGDSVVFDQGSTRWNAIYKLCTAKGYEVYFDPRGFLKVRAFRDPVSSAPSFFFETGKFETPGHLVNWERTASDSLIDNHVVVIAERSNRLPIYASARNDDPSSPTRIERIGDRMYTLSSPHIGLQAEAQELANHLLSIRALEQFEVTFGSLAVPWVEAGDVIKICLGGAQTTSPKLFLLTSVTIPLTLEPMSGTARRIRIVA